MPSDTDHADNHDTKTGTGVSTGSRSMEKEGGMERIYFQREMMKAQNFIELPSVPI